MNRYIDRRVDKMSVQDHKSCKTILYEIEYENLRDLIFLPGFQVEYFITAYGHIR